MSGLQSWSASILRPPPSLHPFVSTRDTPTAQIFYLIWWETVQAATITGSGLKGNRLMHLLCKFHTRACYPWRILLASILQNRLSRNF